MVRAGFEDRYPVRLAYAGTVKEASEDEQEDAFIASNTGKPRISKSQSERAEQLRRMMEDEGSIISALKRH